MSNFAENEKKLLKAIQQFKDTAFGLESRYTPYCYEYIDGVRRLNEEKVETFITELEELAKRSSFYTDALTSLIDKFLRVVIRYMDCTFAPYEYKFVSIRKIADTVYKQSLAQVSTFDILITDQKHKIDNSEESSEPSESKSLGSLYILFFSIKHNLNCYTSR